MFNEEPYTATKEDIEAFQIILGSLTWLSIMTRPDIAYATNKLSQFNHNPTPTHMLAAKRVVRYLAGTRELGIRYGTLRILRFQP